MWGCTSIYYLVKVQLVVTTVCYGGIQKEKVRFLLIAYVNFHTLYTWKNMLFDIDENLSKFSGNVAQCVLWFG